MLGLLATVLGASVKLVRVCASAYNRTAALLDRETGPDLTWQWTTSMEVLSCAPRSRASLRNVSKELNSINSINKKKEIPRDPRAVWAKFFVV